jgi:hypothetical protein
VRGVPTHWGQPGRACATVVLKVSPERGGGGGTRVGVMSIHTALFFVHDISRDMKALASVAARRTRHVAVASDVVEDLDARREELERAHRIGVRTNLVDFSPEAFWDGVFALAGGSCRVWIFESLSRVDAPITRRKTLSKAGIKWIALEGDRAARRPDVVWASDDKAQLSAVGLDHWTFEFNVGCVFVGGVGRLETRLRGWLPLAGTDRCPDSYESTRQPGFIEEAMGEALLCLLSHGAHGNEDIALASWKLKAPEVARGMAAAAAEHGIEGRVLTCTMLEYRLWSHDTKLPDCRCEVIPAATAR